MAKAQALEILHMQLEHLPHQRIERLIQKGVIEGFKIDKQLVDALVREKCDICMQSKQRDASRGRTKGDFEITLFSDLGEAESKKVHKLCNQFFF